MGAKAYKSLLETLNQVSMDTNPRRATQVRDVYIGLLRKGIDSLFFGLNEKIEELENQIKDLNGKRFKPAVDFNVEYSDEFLYDMSEGHAIPHELFTHEGDY